MLLTEIKLTEYSNGISEITSANFTYSNQQVYQLSLGKKYNEHYL